MQINRRIALYGIMTALALILSYIESLIPFFFGVPGMKLGLANLVFVIMLLRGDYKGGILINLVRVFAAGFLFGNGFSIIYSLSGAAISMLVMILLSRRKLFSIIGISIAGGVMHNMGQLLAAAFVVSNYKISGYAPALMISGAITGLLIGILASEINHRMR